MTKRDYVAYILMALGALAVLCGCNQTPFEGPDASGKTDAPSQSVTVNVNRGGGQAWGEANSASEGGGREGRQRDTTQDADLEADPDVDATIPTPGG